MNLEMENILTENEVKSQDKIVYSREEVKKSSLEYFNGDDLAAEVWINKYALKDSEGNLYELNPDQMHQRIAKEFSRIEKRFPNPLSYEQIYNLLKNFKYIVPQGSPMAGIGNDFQVSSLSNCFVIGNESLYDSYGGILKLDQELVQLMKRRAGVGLDLSFIRPSGSPVKNSALTSTGVVPYMERYSNSTREVAQDGRRGALMESISIKHPDAESFIDAKMDETKVTGANVSVRIDDEFMTAALDDKTYVQQYPVKFDNPSFVKEINANSLWKKIVHNAWKRAEPGILFWDTILKESIPDCYADLGFETVSTNPCIVGDTLVSVADGRGAVSIKQLAEEKKDIPVYCYDDKGKLCVRYMRNPRITGYNQQIYKITLEDGYTVRVTGNHKIRLKSGEYKEAKDLIYGDSLQIMTKYQAPIVKDGEKSKKDYWWLNPGIFASSNIEHRLIYEFYNNCKIETGHVVHHKDYNTQNNCIDNLELMSKQKHDEFHAQDMLGDKNPMSRAQTEWSEEKWQQYHDNMSESVSGELNGRYSGYNEDRLKKSALDLTKQLNRRFSVKDWQEYAKDKNLPQHFSQWRQKQFNGGILGLSKWAAIELGVDKFNDVDPRLVKTYHNMLESGFDAEIVGHEVIITKQCEQCTNEIKVSHRQREISVCSHVCDNKRKWSNAAHKEKVSATRNVTETKRKSEIALKQVKIYSDLKFVVQREPLQKEWKQKCKELNVSSEYGRKSSPIKTWNELKEMAESYNHKVLSIELDGFEDVYNGTVDEFHNFFIGNFESKTKNNKRKILSINTLNCGEITLCSNDSCRLLILNLYSYVTNPFTEKAQFNFPLFLEHTEIAQRLMDDLIELELEKVDKILEKIESDPEPEVIKSCEKQLWLNIKKKCIEGRRTGLGVTAEGDMLAALGITYGTNEGNSFSEEIHRNLKLSAYRSSVNLAKERGAFPIYDSEREKHNPFIQRIKGEDLVLYKDMVKHGRRNIALLTIAPTGSVSILTQSTSGIEPAFLISYMRRRKINPNDKDARIDFTDKVGDCWQNYPVFHHKFKDFLAANGYEFETVEKMSQEEIQEIISKSPYYKATSNDVDWIKKVEMQGMIQKHVDHSISVTVNLPSDVTEELVSKVYEKGWKSGCKGITVYRDGCRSGVLVANEEKKVDVNKIIKTTAPKRPKTLSCDIYQVTANGKGWIVIVGLLEKEPYEVFALKPKNIHIPARIKTGQLTKVKNGVYNLECDGFVIENLSNHFDTDEHEVITRLASGLLRHGMDIKYIVDQLNKSEGTIVSFGKAIARTLKKYMENDTISSETCPSCNEQSLIFQEGCLVCSNCGVSKCG